MSARGDIGWQRSPEDIAADAWYEALIDGLQILGKRWDSDTTDEEDAFVLAYADEVAVRPASERQP